jgi:hypothetical protein
MTRLVDELLTGVLQSTPGWRLAHPKMFVVQEYPEPRSDHPITMG